MSASFLRLIHWEVRRLRAEFVTVTLVALWMSLLAVAAWQGATMTHARHVEIADARSADALAWNDKRARLAEIEAGRAGVPTFGNPRSPTQSVLMSTSDRPVTLQPTPLAALAVGASETSPVVKRSGVVAKVYLPPDNLENPANRLAGRLDLAFVVSALLPLFVLALAFDVLARERELGIWPVLASQPTRISKVVRARLGLHFVLLWVPLVITASAAVLSAQPEDASTIASAGELVLWLVLAAVYLLFWQAVAAWINFRGQSAAGNALALCGAWVLFAVLIPAAVQLYARAVAPAPDHLNLVLVQRNVDIASHDQADQIRADFYARHGYQPPTVALSEYDTFFVNNIVPRAFAADQKLAPALNEIRERREAHGQRLTQLAWLSPSLAFRLATEQLAGVTPPQQHRLIEEARRFQRAWRAHFGAKLASMTNLTLADYDTKPEPPQVIVSFRERLALAALPIGGLLAASFLVMFLAVRTHAHD